MFEGLEGGDFGRWEVEMKASDDVVAMVVGVLCVVSWVRLQNVVDVGCSRVKTCESFGGAEYVLSLGLRGLYMGQSSERSCKVDCR